MENTNNKTHRRSETVSRNGFWLQRTTTPTTFDTKSRTGTGVTEPARIGSGSSSHSIPSLVPNKKGIQCTDAVLPLTETLISLPASRRPKQEKEYEI